MRTGHVRTGVDSVLFRLPRLGPRTHQAKHENMPAPNMLVLCIVDGCVSRPPKEISNNTSELYLNLRISTGILLSTRRLGSPRFLGSVWPVML